MKPKKPDKFERVVSKLPKVYDTEDGECLNPLVDVDDVIKLLRKEHRWMVRMIHVMQSESWSMKEVDAFVNGYQRATYDILDQLKRRAM